MAVQYTVSQTGYHLKIWQAVHTATITAKQKKNEESIVNTLTNANPDRDKEYDYRAVFAPFSICTVKYISFITKKKKISIISSKEHCTLKTHFSGNHVLMFSAWPSLHSAASHPLLHLSSDSFSSLCLCDSIHISVPNPPPLCQFYIRPLTEQSLCSYSELISQSSCSCISKDSSVSQVMGGGGLSKPRFNSPSGCPHVLSWALSVITGRYLAKWNYVSSSPLFSSLLLSSPLFLMANQARGLWHSFGLFLVVSLPRLYWLNVTLRQLGM